MKQLGFFSKTAKEAHLPVAVFLNDKGEEVEVTAMYESEEKMKALYGRDDAVCVGELGQFVRRIV